MKTIVIATILIFVGLICFSASNITVETRPSLHPQRWEVELVKNVTLIWKPYHYIYQFDCALQNGSFVYLRISPPSAWGEFSGSDPTDEYRPIQGYKGPFFVYIDFNYTTNDGEEKTTSFELVYYYKDRVQLGPIRPIHIYLNRSDTLIVDNPTDSMLVGGIAKYNGTYKIAILGPFPPDPNLKKEELEVWEERGVPVPIELWKYKYWQRWQQPYKLLLPVGVLFMIFGAATLIMKGKNKKQRLRNKNKH